MGIFDFVSSVGKKLGIDYFEEQDRIKKLDEEGARLTAQRDAREKLKLTLVSAVNAMGLSIEGFAVSLVDTTAKLSGNAKSQADKEKAVLCVGNHAGIDKVDDSDMTVTVPEPPAVFHTVVKGDTLSLIAKKYYGIIMAYPDVATANQPLIKNADDISPGWVIRIPPLKSITYTLKKGDTLSSVAKTMYGDMMKYPVLADANKDVIKNPDVVEPGWTIVVPALFALPGQTPNA